MKTYTIKFKRAPTSICIQSNPVVRLNELVLCIDTGQFKIGDGTKHFNDLSYSTTLPIEGIQMYFDEIPREKNFLERFIDGIIK